MRLNLLFVFASAFALLSIVSCDKPPSPDAASIPPPVETSEPEPENDIEIEALEARAEELQQQIEAERLAEEAAALAEADRQNDSEIISDELEGDNETGQEPLPDSPTTEESELIAPALASTDLVGAPPESAELPAADYSLFYEELAPMGEWFETEEYGFVWQPFIARTDKEWRPYTLGRWVDSDQGWTWISDEPFGWATYHYGRWAVIEGIGWVWIPGDVWAPSWVAWRNSEEYIGWCPLPPETLYYDDIEYGPTIDYDYGISPSSYTFMPIGYFDEPVYSYCEPPWVSVNIYPQTINVTHLVVRRSHVHCGGPKRDYVRRHLGHDPHHYDLKCEPGPRHPHGEGGHRRPRIDKGSLTFCAPNVKAPWNARLRPASCSRKLEKPIVVHSSNWPKKQAIRSRFDLERQRQTALANEVIDSSLGEKVMERQDLLSKIHLQRQAGIGPTGKVHPAEPNGLPPRAIAVRTSPEPRALLDRMAADALRKKAETASMPITRNRDDRDHKPSPFTSQNPGGPTAKLSAAPRNSIIGTSAEPDIAATRMSSRSEPNPVSRPGANRAVSDLADVQRNRQAPPLQPAEIKNRTPNASGLAGQSPPLQAQDAPKGLLNRQSLAQEAESRHRKIQLGNQKTNADARQKAQKANQHGSSENRSALSKQLLTHDTLRKRQEEISRQQAAERAASERQRAATAEATRQAEAERQKAATEQASKARQHAAAEAAKRTAMERAARDQQQRAAAEASKRADELRQRAAAEQTMKARQHAAAEAAKRAEEQRQRAAAEQTSRARQQAAEASMREEADRAARERQQRAAAEASKRADEERQRAAAEQASKARQHAAAAAEAAKRDQAAKEQQQRAAAARQRDRERAAREKQQAENTRQRAAAEKASKARQHAAAAAAKHAAAEASKRAEADRQRTLADRAARDQQQRAAAEAAKRADAERQRAAAQRANREQQQRAAARAQQQRAAQQRNNNNKQQQQQSQPGVREEAVIKIASVFPPNESGWMRKRRPPHSENSPVYSAHSS